jgi:hypothetical protein
MHNRSQTAVVRGPKGDALNCVRPIADAVKHLASREHHLDRATRYACAECSQCHTRLLEIGTIPMIVTAAEFGAYISAETEKWAKVVKFAGIKPE